MPQTFRLPLDFGRERPTELWTPFVIDPTNLGEWGNRLLYGIGRLRAGETRENATSQFQVLWKRWIDAGFIADHRDLRAQRAAVPVREMVTGEIRGPLLILVGTVAFVLLIALANVANLWMSRSGARGRDFAVRAALGASRGRLVGQALIETICIAAAGGAVGVALAAAVVRTLIAMHAGTLPRIEDATLDLQVLGFTAAISLGAGVLFGLAPALQLAGTPLNIALNDDSRGATAGRGRQYLRQALVVIQMTLSVVLVLGAGLLIRSLVELNRVPLGYRTDRVLTAQVQLPAASYPAANDIVRFYRQLNDRLGDIPGVHHAGFVRILPLSRAIGSWSITLEGQPYSPHDNPNADFQYATPGYFEAMQVPPLQGRRIVTSDTEDSQLVVVINDTMAKRYWPGEDPLGKRFHVGTIDQPWLTIVGVVPTVRHNAIVEAPRAEMYIPHAQVSRARAGTPRSMALVMRTEGDPRDFVQRVREAIRAIDANLPLADIRTMEEVEARALAEPRLLTTLLGGFAALALVLAAVGIHGTMSLLVADRAQEIGIRLALGAQRGAILKMILSQGAALTGMGIAIGLVSAVFLTRLLEKVVYGVTTSDPLTFVTVPLLLGTVALVAAFTPARRASRLDPIATLRR